MKNNSSHSLNFNLIDVWNGRRKIEHSTRSIFKQASNRFSFIRPAAFATGMHIYLGYDFNTNMIKVTIVDPIHDTLSNRSCIGIYNILNGNKHSISHLSNNVSTNPDQISWEEAHLRIENWKNDKIRNEWINQRFTDFDSNNAILQAFSVNQIDTQFGQEHNCYLALKYSEVSMTYEVDLIIQNVTSGVVLKALIQKNGNLEDLVYPIPPFDRRHTLDKFGLLRRLNEQ